MSAVRHTAPVEGVFDLDAGDGLRLHVERSGDGKPLLLLHGFTGSIDTWTPLRDALRADHDLVTVDLPGHGRSTAPRDPARYELRRLADDLAWLLDTLGLTRAAVLGYSLGGRAALRFALAHPDRVDALVLESASPGIADAPARAARVEADTALAGLIERGGVSAFVDAWERLALWRSQEQLPLETRARLRAQRLANNAQGLANSLRGAGAGVDEPVIDRLSSLAMPVLVVAGALDPKYVVLGEMIARAMPRARMAVMREAGHAVHLERPEVFAALVREFLDDPR